MKTIKSFTILLFALMFFACTKKSDIKTFEFYHIMQTALLSKSEPIKEMMSGKIIIDKSKEKVTLTFNGCSAKVDFKIEELNNPIVMQNLKKLGLYEKGIDVYSLLLIYDPNAPYTCSPNTSCVLCFFTAKTKNDTAFLIVGENATYFGGKMVAK